MGTPKKNKYYINLTELDEGLVIYQSPDATKKNWYVRILLKKGGYVRRSTKTSNKERAKREAYRIQDTVKEREYLGLSHTKTTFETVARAYLRSLQHSRSQHRLEQIETSLNRYLLPYFGHMYMSSFFENTDYVNDYPLWRKEYWARYDKEVKQGQRVDERFKAVDGTVPKWDKVSKRPIANYSYNPSQTAIKMNIIIYNAIMRYAAEHKHIQMPVLMSYKNLPVDDVRSQSVYTFSEDEIRTITTYFQQDYKRHKTYLKDDKGNRVKDAQGNDKYELYKDRRSDHKHMRINMRGWYYLMVNTGIRVRSANYLKWKDITQRSKVMDDGTRLDYLALNIEEYKSKRIEKGLRFRTVYAPHHLTRILNEVRRQNAPYNTDDDYVFSHEHKRAPLLNMSRYAFRRVLKELGLYEHKSGAKRTAKHLRSYYASKLLQKHPIHLVAATLGNSIEVAYRLYAQLEIAKKAYEILGDVPQPPQVVLLDKEDQIITD
jgi:hypothetical protein